MSDQPRRRRPRSPYATPSGRLLVATTALLAAATIVGLVALWPHEEGARGSAASGAAASGGVAAGDDAAASGDAAASDDAAAGGDAAAAGGDMAAGGGASTAMGGPTVAATVTRVFTVDCGGPQPQDCVRVEARLGDGRRTAMTLGPVGTIKAPAPGAHVRLQPIAAPPTGDVARPHVDAYAYAGIDRRRPLALIALVFAALVVLLARARGLLALAGLGLSIALVTTFVLPAILAGKPAAPVALTGSLAVMFVTVLLTYGVTPPSLAACLGIAASLILATLAGAVAVHAAQLDGRSGELGLYLAAQGGISLPAVVLAGLVIGALGVLADMGVTQASTVMALRRANPELSASALFTGAFGVGRDHLIAATHTLVLAYLGASLPLLLTLTASGVATTDVLNAQEVAEPIVATLIGALALLVSVPLTTALCAAITRQMPPESLPGHHHH